MENCTKKGLKPNPNKKQICPKCNKWIKYENSKYCTNCGHKLITSNQVQ